jgi:hypothetical protein
VFAHNQRLIGSLARSLRLLFNDIDNGWGMLKTCSDQLETPFSHVICKHGLSPDCASRPMIDKYLIKSPKLGFHWSGAVMLSLAMFAAVPFVNGQDEIIIIGSATYKGIKGRGEESDKPLTNTKIKGLMDEELFLNYTTTSSGSFYFKVPIGYHHNVEWPKDGYTTKQPIGQYENSRPFENHVSQLESGDQLYVFSDGFADQFAGNKGKKQKQKLFKELLSMSTGASFKDQREFLYEYFVNWRGQLEQIDDVCVMRVKVYSTQLGSFE